MACRQTNDQSSVNIQSDQSSVRKLDKFHLDRGQQKKKKPHNEIFANKRVLMGAQSIFPRPVRVGCVRIMGKFSYCSIFQERYKRKCRFRYFLSRNGVLQVQGQRYTFSERVILTRWKARGKAGKTRDVRTRLAAQFPREQFRIPRDLGSPLSGRSRYVRYQSKKGFNCVSI